MKEEEKGAAKMCAIAEEIYEGGRQEGELQERFRAIQTLMSSMDMSAEQAMKALKIPESEMPKYINSL